jgi:hypothetical protein
LEEYIKLIKDALKTIMFINNIHNMTWKDLDKRRKYQREYYRAKKAKRTVRQQLLDENEALKVEVERLRKALVFYQCPECQKVSE